MIRFCLKTKKEVITVLRKKRWVRYALVFCLCSIMATGTITAKAEEADTSGARIMPQEYIDAIEDTDPLRDFVPPNIDFMCEPLVTRSTTISVPVTEPCDQEWRATYPDNWMWQANRAIRDAAAPLKDFGIQYYSVSQKYWDSSSTTSSALVQEAKDEWGLRDGASLMIAFTGKTYGGVMGQVSDIGDPYIIVFDYGYDENKMTVLHESGHPYGLRHCTRGTNCVMSEAAPIETFNSMCPSHKSQWEGAKNTY